MIFEPRLARNKKPFEAGNKFWFCVVPLNGGLPLPPNKERQRQNHLGCDHWALFRSPELTMFGFRDLVGVGIGPFSKKKLAVKRLDTLNTHVGHLQTFLFWFYTIIILIFIHFRFDIGFNFSFFLFTSQKF